MSQGNETLRLGGRDINSRAYLSRFNFSGTDQSKLCGVLSGGERNRLQLAMALKQEGNVLLLDEPTNDIDVNTLRALEEGLDLLPVVRRHQPRPLVPRPHLHTSRLSKAMAKSSSSKAVTRTTKSTKPAVWATRKSRKDVIGN